MDKGKTENRWAWLPKQMPGVAARMAALRAELGADWVNTCWRHGVVQGEPGWFYAAEGALAVGTLWTDPEVIAIATAQVTRTQALVMLRPKDATHGA